MMTIKSASLILSTAAFLLIRSSAQNLKSRGVTEFFDYKANLDGNETCSLIEIVMDESGSMVGEQDFIRNIAVPQINLRLTEVGIDNIFFCSYGFGSNAHVWGGGDIAHYHGCTEGTSDGILDTGIMDSWVYDGNLEDGWQAIAIAMRDTPATINGKNLVTTCKTLGKNMILVTDEKRFDNSCNDGNYFEVEIYADDSDGSNAYWELLDSDERAVYRKAGNQESQNPKRYERCLHNSITNNDKGFVFRILDQSRGYIKIWYNKELVFNTAGEFPSELSILVPDGTTFIGDSPPLTNMTNNEYEDGYIFTRENTIEELLDNGYRLNVVTNISLGENVQLDGGKTLLGVSAESVIFQPDDFGSFFENWNFTELSPTEILRKNSLMAQDYATIAFATGGAAWGLDSLRGGGKNARSFAKAFTEIKAQEIKNDTFSTPSPTDVPSVTPSIWAPTPSPSTSQPTVEDNSDSSARMETGDDVEVDLDGLSTAGIIGIVFGGLVATVLVAFLASRDSRNAAASDFNIKDSTDEEEDSSVAYPDFETPIEDDDHSFAGSVLSFMGSMQLPIWNDQDHLVDLSELPIESEWA